ncbi:helix-turn-helix transcriptional regulator [Amycolatopsis rifamycinica]|uniref:helix-turn-helix transcriptional regulator n=1 Tax=Amycolatopsis rifamycinica TaxID=287986 RepID=UPI0005C19ACB|nr:LuxR family transcriptional regulator [Amycolatopsis rifamycinica]
MDLFGRDHELATVLGVVVHARTGPRALLVLGDAGAGKTALLDAAARRAAEAGYRLLAAQGCVAEAEQSFSGLHQLLRPVLPAVAGLAAHLREAVEVALGTRPAAGAPDPAVLRLAVLTLFGALAAERPLVLLVDDVQLIDDDSCDVLMFVLRRLTTERLAVVLAALGHARPVRVDAAVPALTLEPLSDAAAARLVDSLPSAPTGRVRLEVLQQAAGSPLALLELARAAARGGTSVLPGRPLRGDRRLAAVYAGRLDGLPDRTRRLAVYAAAADGAGLATTMAAAGVADLSAWTPAEEAGLLTVAAGGVAFRHPLVRAAAYESAPAELRARVHRDLAAVLHDDPERRAWHLAEAAIMPDESVAAELEKAAELSRQRGGIYAAARAWERAAECTPDPGDRARRYARAIHEADNFGDPVWIRELHDRIVRLTDDPALLGVAAAGAGHALSLSAHQREAFDLLHAALLEHGPGDGGTALALLSVLAAVAVQSGLPRHRAVVAELLARPEAGDDGAPDGLLPAAARPAVRENILVQSDPAGQAVALFRRAGAAVHRTLDGPAELVRLLCLGSVSWFADESDGCVTAFRQVFTLLGARRSHGMVVMCGPAFTSALIATGRWTEAGELIEELRECAAVHHLRYVAVDAEALHAELTALRGEPGADRAALDAAWPSIDLTENLFTHLRLRRAAGLAALNAGDVQAAHRHLRELFAADGTPHDAFLSSRSVADLAFAAKLTGHGADAAEVVAAVRTRLGEHPSVRMRLLLHRADALVAEATAGRAAEVERGYRLAVIDPAGEQWPLERAQARLDYARWLRRRRRPLDARPLFTAALETFTRLGAAGLADLARGELRASGAAIAGPVEADPLEALTSQQREIVRLAARGLRNREIAEQLFLSPRTVGSHLHNAYPKLGISGRHQLRDLLDG